MNKLGTQKQPFVFLFDFMLERPLLFRWEESGTHLLWKTPLHRNYEIRPAVSTPFSWNRHPVSFACYQTAFNRVMAEIMKGNSYLLNLTMPTRIFCELKPEELFSLCHAPYLVYLKDHFLCFSPEIFVRIEQNSIRSYPMKGTVNAEIPKAEERLLNNRKERAEHATIVDLIRNDLSRVAQKVEVIRYGYLDRIRSNSGSLLQMSSEITGSLAPDWIEHLGDLFMKLLPAGSVSGAPKRKTVEIIRHTEPYERGYYSGVFGIFDGKTVDSCVLIRYLENQNRQLIYKSGGGITHLSSCEEEYEELIRKIYVPLA
ncbi:MAG: aminodeoxychorismate synthase component I [Mangrovibacterium sp.]